MEKNQSLEAEPKRMTMFRRKQEGTKRLAKINGVEIEIRIVLTSRPRYENYVKKGGSSTVRYYRHEMKSLGKAVTL